MTEELPKHWFERLKLLVERKVDDEAIVHHMLAYGLAEEERMKDDLFKAYKKWEEEFNGKNRQAIFGKYFREKSE